MTGQAQSIVSTRRSVAFLRDRSHNKSIAFTRAERRRLGQEGLLPDALAVSVAEKVHELKLARAKRPVNLRRAIERFEYEP